MVRPREQTQDGWPDSISVLRVIARALVSPESGAIKGKAAQRFLAGKFNELSPERTIGILRAMVEQFFFAAPIAVQVAPRSRAELAKLAGFSSVEDLNRAALAEPRIAEFCRLAENTAPLVDNIVRSLVLHLAAWDDFLTSVGQRQPGKARRHWLLGQLRIAIVEVGVLCGYLAFKDKRPPTSDRPRWLVSRSRDDKTIRDLLKVHGHTRAKLVDFLGSGKADAVGQLRTTVDRWCDQGRRPSGESLQRIGIFIKGPRPAGLVELELRRHFALRALTLDLNEMLGADEVADLVDGLLRIYALTYAELSTTRVVDSMHEAICDGVIAHHLRVATSPFLVRRLLVSNMAHRWRVALRALRWATYRSRPGWPLAYPRLPLLTELTDAVESDIFRQGSG